MSNVQVAKGRGGRGPAIVFRLLPPCAAHSIELFMKNASVILLFIITYRFVIEFIRLLLKKKKVFIMINDK